MSCRDDQDPTSHVRSGQQKQNMFDDIRLLQGCSLDDPARAVTTYGARSRIILDSLVSVAMRGLMHLYQIHPWRSPPQTASSCGSHETLCSRLQIPSTLEAMPVNRWGVLRADDLVNGIDLGFIGRSCCCEPRLGMALAEPSGDFGRAGRSSWHYNLSRPLGRKVAA